MVGPARRPRQLVHAPYSSSEGTCGGRLLQIGLLKLSGKFYNGRLAWPQFYIEVLLQIRLCHKLFYVNVTVLLLSRHAKS